MSGNHAQGENNAVSGLEEPATPDDFWNDRDEGGGPGVDAASRPDFGVGSGEQAGHEPVGAEAMDVDATLVPAKRSKVVPIVFGAIFLGAVAVAGSALWTGYQKMQPKRPAQQNLPTGGGLIDVGKEGAERGAGGEGSAGGLPPVGGKASAGVLLVQPGASVPTTTTVTTDTSAPVDPAAVAATAQAQERAKAEQDAQEVAMEKAKEAAALAAQQAVAASKGKVAKVDPKPKPKPSVTPNATRSAGAKSDGPRRNSARGTQVASAKSNKNRGKAATMPQVEAGVGALTQYKVMSIWPRSGEFQQAWVKSRATGQVHIVRAGEVLDGMQVLSVDSKANLVRTNQGEVR